MQKQILLSLLLCLFAGADDNVEVVPDVIVYGKYDLDNKKEDVLILKNNGADEKFIRGLVSRKKFIERIPNPEAHTEYLTTIVFSGEDGQFHKNHYWIRGGSLIYEGESIKLQKLLIRLGVIDTYNELLKRPRVIEP